MVGHLVLLLLSRIHLLQSELGLGEDGLDVVLCERD